MLRRTTIAGRYGHFLLAALLVGFSSTAQAQVPLDSGLVGFYPFNSNALDESGRGNDGTVFGATPTTNRFGQPDAALAFDGDDWVDLGDSTDFRFAGDFSISLWIDYPGGFQDANIIYKRQPSNPFNQYGFGVFEVQCCFFGTESNYLGAFIRNDQDNGDRFLEPTEDTLTAGWHHVVLLNEADGRSFFYLDNELVDSSEATGGTYEIVGHPLVVGATDANDADKYTGKIDDIRIYNRLLQPAEVDTLFSEVVTSLGAAPAASRYHVYPNPARGTLHVTTPAAAADYALYDLRGQEVPFVLTQRADRVALTTPYRGLTILRVQTADGVFHDKVRWE